MIQFLYYSITHTSICVVIPVMIPNLQMPMKGKQSSDVAFVEKLIGRISSILPQ